MFVGLQPHLTIVFFSIDYIVISAINLLNPVKKIICYLSTGPEKKKNRCIQTIEVMMVKHQAPMDVARASSTMIAVLCCALVASASVFNLSSGC